MRTIDLHLPIRFRKKIAVPYLVFLALTVFLMSYSHTSRAAEYHFCLSSNIDDANVTTLEYDGVTAHEAAKDAEEQYCYADCDRFVCAATPFDDQTCGSSQKMTLDFTHAQSKCEVDNPTSGPPRAVADVTILLAPDQAQAGPLINGAVTTANNYLAEAQCPLSFIEAGGAKLLPDAFTNFQVSDAATLRSVARYPGLVKVVRDITYCEDPTPVTTIDSSGKRSVLECPSRTYSSVVNYLK